MNGRSPYMNTQEVAEYLRILDSDGRPSTKGARKFLDRHPNVRRRKRGASVLVHRDDLDAACPLIDLTPTRGPKAASSEGRQ